MNRRALYTALAYSALVILIKLFIIFKQYYASHFGFYYAHILTVLLILPFFGFALKNVRDKENNGVISGRECMRICLTILAVSAIILTVYNYAEVKFYGKQMAEVHYRSDEYMTFLKKQRSVKPEQYNEIIETQISGVPDNAFRFATAKLFPFVLIGLSGAFVISMVMKRRPE
jgi:hypothetical protein